ncbi:16S rRNA (cytosine(967)-C(5))-methyltransferase RsmB [Desulforamulus ferrireducens]|uniref:16S rRNA (cytosine(967)-C(5))-methyltransferase n=1 Tax=Desulforamulus ferrireducens TaxID=1833852 RepID=A0A1S6IWB1_9FIRM|nr:16S rRNA (cytosine(967)-C(5))-methyltransferase RsmB [Desulforamulus ferrireducens]AQS59053.1 16S rRNA (cytosine(967)-C(5))-methyltransferase [Desulforamulus ferrireducens]
MSNISARELALLVGKMVEEEGAYANLALNKVLEQYQPGKLDRAFATELVYGVLRKLNTLDWVLAHFLKQPLASQTVWVRNILRMGTYQIMFMPRVPDSAACNESVNLAKKYGHAGAAKFVNGVLRNVAREQANLDYPDPQEDPVDYIALKYSHPTWLVERWLKEFGFEETVALCQANNRPAPNTVRTNTLKITREALIKRLQEEAVEARETKYVPEGLNLNNFLSYRSLSSFQEGLYQVQDESSMLVAHVLNPATGSRVLDVASAPGGKTTHVAQLMRDTGEIIACDLYAHKLDLIMDNCRRLGITSIRAEVADARELYKTYQGWADYVLVDAPCSGLGVLRRRPDARWRKDPSQLPGIVRLQKEILQSAAKCLRPGGVLVYSTCTITPEENLGVVQDFLAEHPEFSLGDLRQLLPPGLDQEATAEKGYLQLLPHVHGMDGFFIARLRKKGFD